MAVEMVHTVGVTQPVDDQSWLINRITDGVREAQLDLSLFTGDETKEAQYFASITPDDFNAWLKSGIPVGKVTDTGLFGPYDPDATDGRQLKVYGFLESQLHVVFTRSGFEDQYPTVGIRYMGVIDKSNLPVVPADGTPYEGLILDYEKATGGDVSVLSPAAATAAGAPTVADGSITNAKLADGAATPAKLAGYDGNTGHGKLPQVKGDGTGFDFIDPGTLKAAQATPNVLGTVKQAAYVADPAGNAPTKAEYVALRDALVTAGIMAPKA